MEIYTGPEQRTTETYMIPGTGHNPHVAYIPQLEEVDYMANEVAPEYIYDQGLYYPAANLYGYYCTGFESPGEWDDHNRVFGVDGQELPYSGMQAESLPYVYYSPSYGYTQSPYNPYNPYIPGAVMGLDGAYLGTQQYVTNPSYQTPESSPAYIPVVVQPSADIAPNSTQDPLLFSTGASVGNRHINVAKYTPPLTSTNIVVNGLRPALGNPTSETSQSSQNPAKSSDKSLVNALPNKQSLSQGAISLGSATHAAQIKNSPGSMVPHHFSHGRVPTVQNPLKVTAPVNDSFPQFGSNIRGWATVDKFRPRLQYQGDFNNPSGGIDVLGEQNKGPRTSRSKGQWTSAFVDGVYPTKSGASNDQQSIVISADQYNRDDFPVNYPNAKFFVIKSYSEDDVHKSIKYKVWSSTSNGNKRLDSAYQDAQRISVGQPTHCPIFLFFSVNASGQFCGVAEMIGPVNFDKDMDFWQQDKWTGSFPVKWHIAKDVPNTSFRHIILENNENKPVTNSRDTQEIPYLPGVNMLNIFKCTPLKTSILDDFVFYEERERIMQEEKSRLLGRSYDASQFLPAVIPVDKSDCTVPHPSKAGEKQSSGTWNESLKANLSGTSCQPCKADGKQPNGTVNWPPSSAGKPLNGAVDQPSKTDGKPPIVTVDQPPSKLKDSLTTDQPPKADRNPNKLKDPKKVADQPPSKPKDSTSTDQLPKVGRNPNKLKDPWSIADQFPKADRKDSRSTCDQRPKADRKDSKTTSHQPPKADGKNPNSTGDQHSKADRNPSKPKDAKQDTAIDASGVNSTTKAGSHAIDSKEGDSIDVVTVGSMPIRVKVLGESPSSVITVGSGPTEPKSVKHNKPGALVGVHPHQK